MRTLLTNRGQMPSLMTIVMVQIGFLLTMIPLPWDHPANNPSSILHAKILTACVKLPLLVTFCAAAYIAQARFLEHARNRRTSAHRAAGRLKNAPTHNIGNHFGRDASTIVVVDFYLRKDFMKRYFPIVLSSLTFLGAVPMAHAASQAASDTAGHNNAFAGTLYAQLNKSNADKNLFLSPYSISAALGMTAQGARGTTADQMNKVLNIDNNFQAGMAEITKTLNPKDAPFALSVANALWVDQIFSAVQTVRR